MTDPSEDFPHRMSERLTPQQFHDADGVEDWRVVTNVAQAHFRTGSFPVGVALVDAIGTLADAAGHLPEVDLRPEGVTVRLTTWTPEHFFWLSERDVDGPEDLGGGPRAGRPRRSGRRADRAGHDRRPGPPGRDAVLARRARLPGGRRRGSARSPRRRAGVLVPADGRARTERNRIHIDVWVPHDQAEARVAAAIAAGGHLVSDDGAPTWWTLADAEGNEADVATWLGRD